MFQKIHFLNNSEWHSLDVGPAPRAPLAPDIPPPIPPMSGKPPGIAPRYSLVMRGLQTSSTSFCLSLNSFSIKPLDNFHHTWSSVILRDLVPDLIILSGFHVENPFLAGKLCTNDDLGGPYERIWWMKMVGRWRWNPGGRGSSQWSSVTVPGKYVVHDHSPSHAEILPGSQ